MGHYSLQTLSRFRRTPALPTLFLLALVLVVFLAAGGYTSLVLKRSKEADLGRRLESVGTTAAAIHLNGYHYATLDSGATPDSFMADSWNEITDMRYSLRLLAERNNLESVMIIDLLGKVLLDSAGEFYPGEDFALLELDQDEMQIAMSGVPSTTIYYRVGDSSHKRCYIPLKNSEGKVTALLRIEASQDYFQDIRNVQEALIWVGAVILALLSVLGFLFYRMLKALMETRESLAFADRLKSIGALAAGLAHEIRNPLGIIRITVESLAEELPENPEQQALLKSILEETDRLNHLVSQFLQFAGPSDSSGASFCQPDRLIEAVIDMARKDISRHSLTVFKDIEPDLPQAAVGEKGLKQVLLNLILNARDASPEGGAITVSCRRKRRGIIIEIQDQGPGIPPENRELIFDPFFTTKEGGTGLGLFVSRMIIQQCGGELSVDSPPGGQGTCARIVLPPG